MKLTIQIDAVPQGRPRFYNKVAVDPPKSRKFKEELALLAKAIMSDAKPFTGKLEVRIFVFRNFPSPTNKRYGDIDNLAKGILDALNGVAWIDDSQIVDLTIRKFVTDCKPYIVIWVETIGLLSGYRRDQEIGNVNVGNSFEK